MEDKNNKNLNIENKSNYNRPNLKTVSIFCNDTQAIFIFKKTEKLISAIYLITGFLSDNEPIKWRLRDISAHLMSYSVNLSNDQRHHDRIEAMNNFTTASFEIISLLGVADVSGVLSSMNCNIIIFEFQKIIELVELKERSLNTKFLLSKSFFETTENIPNNNSGFAQGVNVLNKKDNDDTDTRNQILSDKLIPEKSLHKRHLSIKDTNNIVADKGHIVRDKNQRYEVIINLLKKTKEISVKDVSGIVTDCSEKTIQRELLSLVDKGVLKKEGERRWSKYSLAS